MRNRPSAAPFLLAFVPGVLAGCALILLVPHLFEPHEPWWEPVAVALGLLALVLLLAARTLRRRYLDLSGSGPSPQG
jgi:drug/metabolite transporter (DMT)-like permease